MKTINQEFIEKQLFKHNIPQHSGLVTGILQFIEKHIGPLNNEDTPYNITAACAITCQTMQIPTLDRTNKTTCGFKIENVMRHIGVLSKQRFLETIENLLRKSNFSRHSLIEKVGNIKIAFRIFKKYKAIFSHLSIENKIPYSINDTLLSFFWLIFLVVKHNLQALQDLSLSLNIISVLIQQVFCKYIGHSDPVYIGNYIRQRDNFNQLSRISQTQKQNIKNQISNTFKSTLMYRYPSWSPSQNNLISDCYFLTRLVDDLSSNYNRLYLELPQGRFIDESTFLQLSKNLTPQAIAQKSNQKPITKILNFENEDDDEGGDGDNGLSSNDDDNNHMNDQRQRTSEKVPRMDNNSDNINSEKKNNYKYYQKQSKLSPSINSLTPVTLGTSKCTWAQNFILNYSLEIQPSVKKYYESRQIFEDLESKLKKKICTLIEQYIKYAINKEKNINQSVQMYFTFVYMLTKKNPDLNLFCHKIANSLLCVTSYLYNQTTRLLPIKLDKYCQIFQGNLLQCLKIIELILQNCELPQVINNILLDLQKQVLIKQLWDTSCGYDLILEGKNPTNQILFIRLQRKIYERIKQICQVIKVNLTQVQKIQALVNQILNNKLQIIRKTKLDQIIICSICACLNLNETKYNLAINTIFQKYNQLPTSHSYNQINRQHSQEGPKTLFEFYNKVFINQVQDMMSREQKPKYLYTPIRENHMRIIRQSTLNFQNSSLVMGSGTNNGEQRMNNYRKGIYQKMKSLTSPTDSKEKSQQSGDSPYFGTASLKRKITFGPNESNQ